MSEPDKVNILLVDDQPAKLLSYEVILQDLGERLLKAHSGAEALETLLKQEIAVVLVDVCMPQLDGFELAAMIRDHPRCQKIAIIFISAIHLTDMDRLRGYEMGAVDYVPVPVVPEVLRAKVKVFAELYRKTRQLEHLNRELEHRVADRTVELENYAGRLRESERRRSLALEAGQMGSWDCDLATGDCMWDDGQHRIFGVDPAAFSVTPEAMQALIEPDDWERLRAGWYSMLEQPRVQEFEFRVNRPDGEQRWCLGTAAASVDGKGKITRVSGVTVDITERKKAEERQVFLAREVDHRARNVLAVVQSILRLTKAGSPEAYVAAVEGRIRALSRAHILLSESRWEGASLRRLVDEELAPYLTGGAVRVETAGADLTLMPRAAQTVAMVLHELATNAAKYGALSNAASGRIALSWAIRDGGLAIDWLERGGPEAAEPSGAGYGMKLIEASIQQIGGEVRFDWAANGLGCALRIPEAQSLARRSCDIGACEKGMTLISNIVQGNNVLVVEDEALVAMMMRDALHELGFNVVGPCGKIAESIAAVERNEIHAAILDVNLGDEQVYPVAELLQARGIPFAFVTGYGIESIESRYRQMPILQKPIDRRALQHLFVIRASGEARAAAGADPVSAAEFDESRTACL
jgi:PAS domain S-box-containing protein